MATFKHILAATDFSDASRRALGLARSMAAESGARLTVVHVCEVPGFGKKGPIPYDVVTPVAKEAQERIDELLPYLQRASPGADVLVKFGAPAEQILAVAGEVHADLVVLGTHGRRGVAHAFLGSVAERVVRVSPVPVLTVRSRPEE
jgi:nucleotide-binding universal stress UspA family protein